MEFLKYIFLVMIFLSSVFIGILISKRYANRVIELKEIKNALNMLKTKIKFTYEPLPDVFCEISKNLKQNISEIFSKASLSMNELAAKEAWEKSIEQAQLNINNEDINILKGLGKLLRQNRCGRTNWRDRAYKFIYRYANSKGRRRKKKKRKNV